MIHLTSDQLFTMAHLDNEILQLNSYDGDERSFPLGAHLRTFYITYIMAAFILVLFGFPPAFRKVFFFSYWLLMFSMFFAGAHSSLIHVLINVVLHSNWIFQGFQDGIIFLMWCLHFEMFILGIFFSG